MGSNDHETRPVEAGDPLAAEARREVRAKARLRFGATMKQADNFFRLAASMAWTSGEMAQLFARASAAMACKDDTGVVGGEI